jgi:ribosome-associated protein
MHSEISAQRRSIQIRGETIRLGQLLKLAGVVDSGSEVKSLLARKAVSVNAQPETRRGRQLHPGDTVSLAGQELRVSTAPEPQP